MQSIVIGPVALPVQLMPMLAGWASALVASQVVRRRTQVDPEARLIGLFVVALVVARAAFVAQHLEHYLDDPWSIANIRDGGFSLAWGLVALGAGAATSWWRRPASKQAFAFVLAAGVVPWAALAYGLHLYERGLRMPDVVLADPVDDPVMLSSFRGKPAVVNLWATWCPPCRREMPVLAHAQHHNPDIHVVFVNQGEEMPQIERFLDGQALQLENVLLDRGYRLGREYGGGLPTTLFFDASGRQVGSHMGELSHASLAHAIERIRQE